MVNIENFREKFRNIILSHVRIASSPSFPIIHKQISHFCRCYITSKLIQHRYRLKHTNRNMHRHLTTVVLNVKDHADYYYYYYYY